MSILLLGSRDNDDIQRFFDEVHEQAKQCKLCACASQQSYDIVRLFHQADDHEDDFIRTLLTPDALCARSPTIMKYYQNHGGMPSLLLIDFFAEHHAQDLQDFIDHYISCLRNAYVKHCDPYALGEAVGRSVKIQTYTYRPVPTLLASRYQRCLHKRSSDDEYLGLYSEICYCLQTRYRPANSVLLDSPLILPEQATTLNCSMPFAQNPGLVCTSWRVAPEVTLPRIFQYQNGNVVIACLHFRFCGDGQTVIIPYVFMSNPSPDFVDLLPEIEDSLLDDYCQSHHIVPSRSLTHRHTFQQCLSLLGHPPPTELTYRPDTTSLDPLLQQLYLAEAGLQAYCYWHAQCFDAEQQYSLAYAEFYFPVQYIMRSSNPHNIASQICYCLSFNFAKLNLVATDQGLQQVLLPTERAFHYQPFQLLPSLRIAASMHTTCRVFNHDLISALEFLAKEYAPFAKSLSDLKILIQQIKDAGYDLAGFTKGVTNWESGNSLSDSNGDWWKTQMKLILRQVKIAQKGCAIIDQMRENNTFAYLK